MSEVTDIPLLIRKYCIIKKRQESNWPLSRLCSCISGVFCNTRNINLWRNIMHNTLSFCHPANLFLIFMYTRDVKLSFPNNNIKKFTLWIFTLYVTIVTSFQENDPYIYMQVSINLCIGWLKKQHWQRRRNDNLTGSTPNNTKRPSDW